MTALAMPQHVYLHAYLQHFETWLGRDDVNEIIVNRPGEVWIETAGAPQMTRVDAGAIDDRLLERLAGQIARISHQAVNRQHPLLAATLPDGARVQMVGPPRRATLEPRHSTPHRQRSRSDRFCVCASIASPV